MSILLALTLSVTGCGGVSWPDQPVTAGSEPVPLSAQTTAGQTFVALEAGLSGVEVFLSPDTAPSAPAGEIRLHLRADPQTTVDLAESVLPAVAVTQPGFYRFSFPAQSDSHRRAYYAYLELAGSGSLRLASAPGSTYWQGSAYQQGEPLDAQLAFRLIYAPTHVLLGLLKELGQLLLGLAAASLLFVVPGVVLLAWLWPAASALSLGERLGLAAGVGPALYPLLFLWTDVIHLHLGPWYAWLPAAAGLIGLIAMAGRPRPAQMGGRLAQRLGHWWSSSCVWPDLAAVAVTGLVIFTRWWGARQVDLPLWGDSIDHSVIVQLLVDHGGLFRAWQPYADLQTFTYHFGFHSLAAAFHWLSRLPVPQAVLWAGQMLNVLAVVALYPLAVKIGGNRWAGVAAVLVAGLLSPMPMLYTNWGRYTQLAGQVLLPAAIYLTWAILEAKAPRRGLMVLAALVVGGLALTHYRVLLLYAFFVLAMLLLDLRGARRSMKPLLWLAAGSGLLFLPWFINAFGSQLVATVAALATQAPVKGSPGGELTDLMSGVALYSRWFLLLVVLGLAGGLWWRRRRVTPVIVWWGLTVLATNPNWLGLPGLGIISNFAMTIAAYIPVALLAAGAMGGLSQWLTNRWGLALLAGVLALSLWGAWQRPRDIRPSLYSLGSQPDLRAAAWIKRNLPPGARLLINSFFAYDGHYVVGDDGGWWLPVLAGRQVTIPPLKYGLERGDRPDYVDWINALPAAIAEAGFDDGRVQALLREHGVTHVYIGQQRGQVNNPGTSGLQPEWLLASAHFRPVYRQDRVWVFEVIR